MRRPTTVPAPKPIPDGVRNPIEWRLRLGQALDCFESKSSAPDWLVDAFFDATFDADVQSLLAKHVKIDS